MRCMVCGTEMRLVQSVPDEAMLVPGFEHHVLSCPSCHDEERRLVFVAHSAPLSPGAAIDETDRGLLDATLQPAGATEAEAEADVPKETTNVRSEEIGAVESPLPRSPASQPSKSRTTRSPTARAWKLKAELHRARWGLMCFRLGLRSDSDADTPTES